MRQSQRLLTGMHRLALVLLAMTLIAGVGSAAEEKKRTRDEIDRSGDPLDKIVCRRYTVIGSLVATQKECRTRREWDRIHWDMRRIQGDSSCGRPNGC
jgi:hypothetical protein